jgi:hypothetical protein
MRNTAISITGALLLLAQGCQPFSTAGPGGWKGVELVDLGNGIHQMASSGLMWQAERGPWVDSHDQGVRYAENLTLGGYEDWRLPTIHELHDLYLVFDLKKNGAGQMRLDGDYWAAPEEGEEIAGAWEISGQCDLQRQFNVKQGGYVRAVRP